MKFLKKITSKDEAVLKEYNVLYVTDNGEAIIKNGQEPTPNYTITFKDYDDSIISSAVYKEGEIVVVPSDPTREGFEFYGWNPTVVETAVADATYVAEYEEVQPTSSNTITYTTNDDSMIDLYWSRIHADKVISHTYENGIGTIVLDMDNVTNMNNMFSSCISLTSIDLSGLDASNVTDMSAMFYSCSSLTSIDLSGLDASKVTNMNSMFSYCSSLTSIDLSGLDASNVTDMNSMFYGCSSLTSIDLSGLDASNVTDMSAMFYGCSSLTSIDLSGLDASKVTDMTIMFSSCSSLTSIDLSPLNTSNVTNMNNMFSSCISLTSIDLSPLNTSNVTNMNSMFSSCSSLTSIDLSGLDTSNVTDMGAMFSECSSLTSIDLSPLNTSNVTDMNNMFSECSSLTSIDLSPLNTSNVTDMNNMFSDCSSLTSVTYNNTEYTVKCELLEAMDTYDVSIFTSTALLDCYTIRFFDYNGSEIKSDVYAEGEMPIPPTDDEMQMEGYTFIGWDSYVTEAYEDKDYYAQYEEITYTIRFLDDDGSVLDEQTVSYGQYPNKPSEPYKEGYTFIGWDSDVTEAYENKDYYAQYEEE